MKKILLYFLLISFSVFAQEIPKNSRAIIITVSESDPEKIYKSLAAHLIDNGYTIEKSDKDLLYINTERKVVKYAWEVRISATIKDNKIKFTGKQFLPGFDDSENQIRYYGVKGAMYKTCFDEVDRVARTFPNLNVAYSL